MNITMASTVKADQKIEVLEFQELDVSMINSRKWLLAKHQQYLIFLMELVLFCSYRRHQAI